MNFLVRLRRPTRFMATKKDRRGFLSGLAASAGVAAVMPVSAATPPQGGATGEFAMLPAYARAQNYKSLKQSSFDRTGGNRDSFQIAPGATQELFNAAGPGIITHIWATISARS